MRRKCELCERSANIHCESDGASLCWKCDAQVHAANFIAAHHSRTLLCYHCHSLTPWHASGYNLSPTISTCNTCDSEEESQVVPTQPSAPSSQPLINMLKPHELSSSQLQLIGQATESSSWRQFKSQKENM